MADPRIGLVLGGGGARGFAHIAALEALEDLGLRPTAVAGSSMGSIVGAGFAAGHSAEEIRERFLSAFGTRGNVFSRLWRLRPRKLSEVFGADGVGLGKLNPEHVIRAFVDDALPPTFDDLHIPFVAVATDFYGGVEARLSQGKLLQAVAASCALPIIFRPVVIDGRLMIDGSILNPVPVDALPCEVDLTVAVDVISFPEPRDGKAGPTAIEALMGSAQLMMQQLMMPKLQRFPPDLLIRPPIGGYHILDFMKVREILEVCAPVREDIKRKLARLIEYPELRVIDHDRRQLQVKSSSGR